MNFRLHTAAAAILAASLVGSYAYAGEPPAPAKKKQVTKRPPKPTVEDQIQALRQEFQGQIDGLKNGLGKQRCTAEASTADGSRRTSSCGKGRVRRHGTAAGNRGQRDCGLNATKYRDRPEDQRGLAGDHSFRRNGSHQEVDRESRPHFTTRESPSHLEATPPVKLYIARRRPVATSRRLSMQFPMSTPTPIASENSTAAPVSRV